MFSPERNPDRWIGFGVGLGVSAALHPLEYTKVLIKLGYEPIGPTPGKSFLGKPGMYLPNILQYAGHIKKIDGFCGLYRGLTPKLLGSIVGLVCSEKIAIELGYPPEINEYDFMSNRTDEELYNQFKLELTRGLILSVTYLTVSHPFQVISVRMMAQFVGKESLYDSILSSIVEILQAEGISGFFSGLLPKILFDVACLVLTSSTVYFISRCWIIDNTKRELLSIGTELIFSSVLYPLQVVSTCMVVTGSRLAAGRPPLMPEYTGSLDCWNDLSERGDLKRGSSMFWRYVASTSMKKRLDMIAVPALFIFVPVLASPI